MKTYRARVKRTLWHVNDTRHRGLVTAEQAGEVMHEYVREGLIGEYDPEDNCLTTLEAWIDPETQNPITGHVEYYISEDEVEKVEEQTRSFICPKCCVPLLVEALVITEYHDAEVRVEGFMVDGVFHGLRRSINGSYYVTDSKVKCMKCGYEKPTVDLFDIDDPDDDYEMGQIYIAMKKFAIK